MDKILSARIDESVINQIGLLARELNTTKKTVIETAIKLYSEQSDLGKKLTYLKILLELGIVQKLRKRR